MNPAVFPGSHGTRAGHLAPFTRIRKRVARSSLGETTTPRPRNLVVNFPIDGE